MSLEIILASNKAEAMQNSDSLCFPEDIHEFVFLSLKREELKFDRFMRISDYYSDIVYEYQDVLVLCKELVVIIDLFDDNRVSSFFKKYLNLCQLAIKLEKNIYCFSD